MSYLLIVLFLLTSLAVPVHAASVDLTVDNVWLEKAADPGQEVASVAPGEQFNIVASVKNIGDLTGSGYYLDVYYDSDYGRGGPDSISAGEAQIWYVGPLTAQNGTHITTWVMDPDNLIAELDESNNQKEYTFTIGSQTTNTITSTSTTSNSTTTSTETTTTATTTTNSTSSTVNSTTDSTSTTTLSPATVSIIVAASPVGSVVVDGATYASPQAFDWVPGSSHTIAANSPVPGASGTQYVWTSWADGGTQSRAVTAPSSPTTYIANYQTQYYLAVASSYGGPTGQGWYDAGSTATFSVTSPASDGAGTQYVFTGWSSSDTGGYTGTDASHSVAVSTPITETASWKTKWQVSFAVNPSVGGAVTVDGQPFVTTWYDDGAVVSIQANANADYVFSSWSSDSASTAFASSSSASTTATIRGTGTITANLLLKDTTPTLTLTPTSGTAGTLVSAWGSNYKGTTCLLTAAPSNLFNSQACSIVAGTLTGSFTVDSNAAAGDYSMTIQTNGDPSNSATSVFTVTANLASTATTVTLTAGSTLYSYLTTTTTVTSYTGTQTSTSTIVVPATVTIGGSTSTPTVQTTQILPSTSTVQATQVLTSTGTTTVTGYTTTTVTSYTGTQTSTSTIVVPTTVTIGGSTAILTVQRTQFLSSTATATVTGYTTTTVTSYTRTRTSTSTRVVYTTVTKSGAGTGASSPVAYLGFISLLGLTVGGRVTAGEGWRIPRSRSRMKSRCSKTSHITGWNRHINTQDGHRSQNHFCSFSGKKPLGKIIVHLPVSRERIAPTPPDDVRVSHENRVTQAAEAPQIEFGRLNTDTFDRSERTSWFAPPRSETRLKLERWTRSSPESKTSHEALNTTSDPANGVLCEER